MAIEWKELGSNSGGNSEIITITEIETITENDNIYNQISVNLDFEPEKISCIFYYLDESQGVEKSISLMYDFKNNTGRALSGYEFYGSTSNGRVEYFDDSYLQDCIIKNGNQITLKFSIYIDLGSFLNEVSSDYPITILVA